MSAYIDIWDSNTPQGSEPRSLGDDRIREMKRAIDERLETITDWPNGNPLALKPGTVGATQLTANSVTTEKIADQAVTAAKIADHSLLITKISSTLGKRIPMLTIYETTAGASLNHGGADVSMDAPSIANWTFAGVPELVYTRPAQGGVVPIPGVHGSVVTLNVLTPSAGPFSSSTINDLIGALAWSVLVTPFQTDGLLNVYAANYFTGAPIVVTKDVIFRFGIMNLIDPTT